MPDHLKVAEYHDTQAKKEFDRQGSGSLRVGEYAGSGMNQVNHQRAANQARQEHADTTGQIVEYTPIGTPVFRKKY